MSDKQVRRYSKRMHLFAGDPLYVGMDLTIASFDAISEVNMTLICVGRKKFNYLSECQVKFLDSVPWDATLSCEMSPFSQKPLPAGRGAGGGPSRLIKLLIGIEKRARPATLDTYPPAGVVRAGAASRRIDALY
ncbi:Gamma-aminobutyric acid receptor subunit beta-like [Eumeta japonica]|uniref:Gamma-aminobutyric acid receptor subunit beta-like n=1 Tax=Eumeta variegata TaxID=151549 RepID=A0A4C1TSN0_EUMVA|nr:Gamma-aminobutyric acid receptor subunit beta-like [Eumeta japonica]